MNRNRSKLISAGRLGRIVSIASVMSMLYFAALGAGVAGARGSGDAVRPAAAAWPVYLDGVSCTSAKACIATGWYPDGAGTAEPGAASWNGVRWVPLRTPRPLGTTGDSTYLGQVSCTSRDACTTAGVSYSPADVATAFIERWNGNHWRIQSTPSVAGSDLVGAWCASARVCFATGAQSISPSANGPLAERWNGTRWAAQPTPDPAGDVTSTLQGVSCSSPRSCTAVGTGLDVADARVIFAERWNGERWTVQTTPGAASGTFPQLNAAACPTANVCEAAGYYTDSDGQQVPLAERWDGTSWSLQSIPNPTSNTQVRQVSCSSATACTAVGFYGRYGAFTPLIERWNGTTWTIESAHEPAGSSSAAFGSVTCISSRFCVGVGYYTNSSGIDVRLAERWNGTSWSILP